LRVALIHSPKAGDADHSAETLTETIETAGHRVVLQATGDQPWQQGLDDSIDLVVSAGGDGTVRKVFKAVSDTGIPVTLLPLGSANNIARALGFHGDDVGRFVRSWEHGRLRPYQLGLFRTQDANESFVETIGGGLFAELLARAEEREDDTQGEEDVMRGVRMLREIVTGAPALPWDIEVDGEDLSGELLAVEAMTVAETGPNVPLSPDAEPGDGHLDLVLVGPDQREELVSYLDARLADRRPEAPAFVVRTGRRIVLSPPDDSPLRLDDEVIRRPGDARVVRDATVTTGGRLDVLVPALM
jgi:diacylglycerol kinase (ATP)